MKQCLIVDDSAVIRKVARRIIEGLGLSVVDAEDAEMGLAICREKLPDLIIVDSIMPTLDGFEFVRELRKLPDGGLPKVIVTLIERDVGSVARVVAVGGDAYLPKPFDTALVVEKLTEVAILQAAEAA